MALMLSRKKGGVAISNIDFITGIAGNQQATLTGVNKGEKILLMTQNNGTLSGLSSALDGATKLDYAEGIYYGSTYLCVELLEATTDNPKVTVINTAVGAFKLS